MNSSNDGGKKGTDMEFGSSKDRNKHFTKHVKKAPSSSSGFGTGDMHGMFPDAKSYEQQAASIFTQPTAAGGIVEVNTALRQQAAMRWNTQTQEFASGDPSSRRLSTFHKKTPEQFLKAVSEAVPKALPRTISFTPASGSASSPAGSTPAPVQGPRRSQTT